MALRAAQDFNYKVALASGLKSLRAGRLRQAEDQFRYLTQKFPAADGGYRGLAKVLTELEDRPGALAVLRGGASAMAKHGERDGAISLLREAIELDDRDLGTHRRLVAALTLAGEQTAATDEVSRFVRALEGAGNTDSARAAIEYALERLGPLPGLHYLAAERGIALVREPELAPEAPREEPREDPWVQQPREMETVDLVAAPRPEPEVAPEPVPASVLLSAAVAEERATRLIARRDPGAAKAALDAARIHLADGRTSAASDLLLNLIASGLAEHDAQILLVEVAKAIGKRDVAKAKCELLAEALRLEGRSELAGEVDRLAQAV
ncbi:MAG TPA: hypothetical protein VFM93_01595 [Candidatus Limnocylindria bacterium]|nr:hypothetical protein [Candidatus Limnocylindria bacterium]